MAQPTTGYCVETFDAVPNSGSETDFSVLIDIADMSTEWKSAFNTSTGGKGRAYKDSDGTEYATDWIDIDHTANTGWIRVKLSGSVSSGFAVRIFPPNTANTTYSASDTYGSDNAYVSSTVVYYPLDGGDINDRTSNSYDLSATNSPSDVTGQVGGGRSYNGTNEKDEATGATNLPDSEGTIMFWGKEPGTDDAYMEISDGTTNNRWLIYRSSSVQLVVFGAAGGSGANVWQSNSAGTLTAWSHFAFVFDSSPDSYAMYIDGSVVTPDSTNSIGDPSGIDIITLGDRGAGSFPGTPNLDDVHVHTAKRSADWIEHEYNQSNDNAAFWNIGAGTWTWTAPAASSTKPSMALLGVGT